MRPSAARSVSGFSAYATKRTCAAAGVTIPAWCLPWQLSASPPNGSGSGGGPSVSLGPLSTPSAAPRLRAAPTPAPAAPLVSRARRPKRRGPEAAGASCDPGRGQCSA
jgi:hypothetical protein